MARKSWSAVAKERAQYPGVPLLVTKPEPKTSLNMKLLAKLQVLAENEGLETVIKPIIPGRRPMGLWVTWPATNTPSQI